MLSSLARAREPNRLFCSKEGRISLHFFHPDSIPCLSSTRRPSYGVRRCSVAFKSPTCLSLRPFSLLAQLPRGPRSLSAYILRARRAMRSAKSPSLPPFPASFQSREAGFTQPRDHSFVQPCTASYNELTDIVCESRRPNSKGSAARKCRHFCD